MLCGNVGDLLVCDWCDKTCHMTCLLSYDMSQSTVAAPPLQGVVEGEFFGPVLSNNIISEC
jgi:hypothetical protein